MNKSSHNLPGMKSIARNISLIENEVNGYEQILLDLEKSSTKITGITGAPGSGKSTITDLLIHAFVQQGMRVGVLCVDPSSPFNFGALLGDRLRMSDWYNHPDVFIRSLASRGNLGGLNPKIIEITDLMKSSGFDQIIVETVGVGQSEVEIAGLADTTIVVLVPEGGDEIQTMKAGLMEIADIFVVNKADRPGADTYIRNLRLRMAPVYSRNKDVPVVKTIATQKEGIDELFKTIIQIQQTPTLNSKRNLLLAEKAYQLIQAYKMKDVEKDELLKKIEGLGNQFNLYRFVRSIINQ